LGEVARAVLSNFGFEGELATTVPIRHLSGGQKACLKFAKLSLEPAHVLLLDEPTNHLDAEACEALIQGLSDYEGGIVAVTHDEHLVYRLIHCNWATSELLMCQNGYVDRKQSLGSSCLGALKQELRRAEQEDEELRSTDPGKRKACKGKTHSKVSQLADKTPDDKVRTTTVTRSCAAPPPWLLGTRRREKKKENVSLPVGEHEVAAAMLEKVTEDACQRLDQLADCSASGRAASLQARISNLDIVSASPKQEVLAHSTFPNGSTVSLRRARSGCSEGVISCQENESPDSWEDLVTDAPSDSDEAGSEDEVKGVASAESSEADDAANAKPATKSGHSRVRKDLVNLNKAVARWLGEIAAQKLCIHQVEDRIRASPAAKQIALAHGSSYSESRFVSSVLKRARALEARKTC